MKTKNVTKSDLMWAFDQLSKEVEEKDHQIKRLKDAFANAVREKQELLGKHPDIGWLREECRHLTIQNEKLKRKKTPAEVGRLKGIINALWADNKRLRSQYGEPDYYTQNPVDVQYYVA